jgi:hypothetical protein
LAIEVQINAGALELAEEGDEVLQAAAEPVNRPSRDYVELSAHDRFVQSVKPWPVAAPLGAGYSSVNILGRYAPASPIARSHKLAPLVLDCLVVCADAQIQGDCPLYGHGAISSRSRMPGSA